METTLVMSKAISSAFELSEFDEGRQKKFQNF